MKKIFNNLMAVLNPLKRIPLLALTILLFSNCTGTNQHKTTGNDSWHIRMLEAEIHRNPQAWMLDFEKRPKWNYTHGLVLMAAEKAWKETGNRKYFDYIKAYYDEMIDDEGNINFNYSTTNYNIDHIKPGINLFDLYEETGDQRYLTALQILRNQLNTHPRTTDGGFWHKSIYPHQLWLDGVYMNTPFYARYGKIFNEPENFDDVVHQITTVAHRTRDERTGLLFHAYDESREQQWADPQTGHSPNFWGRAMGWYMMSLVDAIEYFPPSHSGRDTIISILHELTDALLRYQDSETGLWYQVIDQGNREGNYLEASVSTMVAYTIAKGVNNQLLDPSYMAAAQKAFQGILDYLVSFDDEGYIYLNNVCAVAGLGGNPYRDGSFEYYISETIRANDPKGVGPFMLLSMEMERAGKNLAKNKQNSNIAKRNH
jgi:unsaturated rhamnogalacturonyl hydrolase